MPLTTQLASQVSRAIQDRGRQYHRRGAVRILRGDDEEVLAAVQGTEKYQVTLERDGPSVRAWCTCPYCAGHYLVCKHIWATLLAAQDRGFLGGAGAGVPRSIELDDERDSGRNGEDDWGEGSAGDWKEEGDRYRREEAWATFQPAPRRKKAGRKRGRKPARARARRRPTWQQTLSGLRDRAPERVAAPGEAWPAGREILYVIDAPATPAGQGLVVEVAHRERKRDGDWGKPKSQRIPHAQIPRLPDPADRQILALLQGAPEHNAYWSSYSYGYYDSLPTRFRLPEAMQEALVPWMCRTGRCRLRRSEQDPEPQKIRWDDGDPWEFWLEAAADEAGKNYRVTGSLRRGAERRDLSAPALLTAGLVFFDDRAGRFRDFGASGLLSLLRREGTIAVPVKQKDKFLEELLRLPGLPRLDFPEGLRFEEAAPAPRPRLKVKAPEQRGWGQPRLRGELSFDYDGEIIAAGQAGRGVYQAARRRLVLRSPEAEAAAAERLRQLGFRPGYYHAHDPELAPRNLPRVVPALLLEGWHVEAEGKLYRKPGAFELGVRSGIDWFELHGGVDFGGTTASLPELLAALRRGENAVRLDDGSYGLLPEEWLKKYGLLVGLGKPEGDSLRFSRTQVGLLDALLASQPEATCDAAFARLRDELRTFAGVEPADPPVGFVGRLRGYQREGLGWLYFLERFGFGGCLADDMGLGKTVQVLALLESRRERRAGNGADRPGPSLVVVPRSLVFNWKEEAARFTPRLRVLDHTGAARAQPGEHFQDADVVLTTYGTLRRDILHLKDLAFDYCVLDEAQAAKNARSETAKAVRLIRADHRLALSGTPVENHLGELWSLFEFLNPGMLGSASVFQLGAGSRQLSEETRTLLARALRPFILRRTKGQVAKDLPEKVEQTVYCELEAAERKRYDELRRHYREALLARVDTSGINKAKMQILEALLRLRQAACHPGLIDKKKAAEPSAKLEALLEQVGEVLEEDHKVLVFSQFTSLLAIVRDRLDKAKVPYEYLDGRTRDRAARVERFQTDPDCKLFLVSLKAGGLGLNLTAAEYVFLLDPWWNPAVEAQAIDRAHRIGQTQQVFAYRLIARDTVEEKVLELQKGKRELADAIINGDNSLIRNLGREDLELLLS